MWNLEDNRHSNEESPDLYKQLFKEDIESEMAGQSEEWSNMGKDQPASCSCRDQEKEMEMDRTHVEKAKAKYSKRGYAVEPTGRER